MELETANNPAPEAVEAEAPELASEANDTDTSEDYAEMEAGDETAAETAEPEFEEVEFNGNRYKVPKEVAPHLMMQADYTRKTQEIAERARSIEAERQAFQREQELNAELTDDLAQKRFVDQRLEQFRNVNWGSLNPQDFQRAMTEQMQLQQAQNVLNERIEGKRSELSAQREQYASAMMQKAVQELSKPDPKFAWSGKFDQSTSASLTEFGKELGFTLEELQNTTHPLMIKTLNLAKIGAETLKKPQQALAKPPVQEAKPVPQVGARKTTPTIANPDKLPPDEWLQWRERQIAKRNRG